MRQRRRRQRQRRQRTLIYLFWREIRDNSRLYIEYDCQSDSDIQLLAVSCWLFNATQLRSPQKVLFITNRGPLAHSLRWEAIDGSSLENDRHGRTKSDPINLISAIQFHGRWTPRMQRLTSSEDLLCYFYIAASLSLLNDLQLNDVIFTPPPPCHVILCHVSDTARGGVNAGKMRMSPSFQMWLRGGLEDLRLRWKLVTIDYRPISCLTVQRVARYQLKFPISLFFFRFPLLLLTGSEYISIRLSISATYWTECREIISIALRKLPVSTAQWLELNSFSRSPKIGIFKNLIELALIPKSWII